MRISGGSVKGRKIGVGKAFSQENEHDELRPTSAKVREAVFDILRNKILGSSFLDLYAGTGAVGIEALSRGAAKAVFVEANALRIKIIRYLLSEFTFEDRARVVKMEAFDFISKPGSLIEKYDIIFLDPPYYSEEIVKGFPLIGEGTLLRDGAVVVVEHFRKIVLPDVSNRLRIVKNYRYGDTMLSMYRLEPV